MNRQDHELAAHQAWLRRLARRLARSSARADDLVQETYVVALRNAPPDAQMRPWLHSVMRKLAWGQVRSEQRRVQREEGFSLTAPMLTLPDVLPDHGVDRERLAAALASLPEPFQSTIVQRFLQGQSCAEIARRENLPAGTVRWRQARGLELLRAELTPRRRFAIWALPFLSVGERLVARFWQSVATRLSGGKALWILLACAAVLYALAGGKAPHGSAADDLVDRRDGVALADVSSTMGASVARAGGQQHGPRLPRGAGGIAGALEDGPFAAAVADRTRLADRDFARAALDDALDIHHDDCTWDPVHGRRCAGAPSTPSVDATCALIRQQLLASAALALRSRTGRTMRAAAMQANRALAQRLGCAADVTDPADPSGTGGKPGDARKPADGSTPPTAPPACTTEYDVSGVECTVCPGQARVCPAPDCHLRTIATGIACTFCTLGNESYDDCPAVQVQHCQSVFSNGLLCSTCDGQPGPPECLPAECGAQESGCIRCIDPKDRVGLDCSSEDNAFSGGASSGTSAPDAYFSSCNAVSGTPHFDGMTCHYVGTQSCVTSESDDWHCLDCAFRDGAALGVCMAGSEPLPDPFADRPSDLPAPGHCVTEVGPDGTVACATCTRADLSATRSCR